MKKPDCVTAKRQCCYLMQAIVLGYNANAVAKLRLVPTLRDVKLYRWLGAFLFTCICNACQNDNETTATNNEPLLILYGEVNLR